MKNNLIAGIIIFFIATSVCASNKKGHVSMFIKFSKENYELGDSIPAEVIFVNTSNDVLVLNETPQKSLDLLMHAVNVRSSEDLHYSIGKIQVTTFDNDKYAVTVPIKEKFEIQPKSVFSFMSDLNERLYLSPGRYDCFLTNYLVEKSNKIALTISFTTGSVAYLLKTALDERIDYGKREWAYDWLKRINPAFELQLTHENDSEDQRNHKKAFNGRAHSQFEKWWNENQKSEECVKRIQQLNQ